MKYSNIILGLILLVFGRKLFWLFVGIAGFLMGMEFTGLMLADQPEWLQLLLALGAGLLGALLAVVAQRVAFAFAGFLAGAYLALVLAQSFGATDAGMLFWAVGGITGAVFAVLIMDPAIIALSCLVGAGAIVRALSLGQMTGILVFIALALTGAVVQTRLMVRRPLEGGE